MLIRLMLAATALAMVPGAALAEEPAKATTVRAAKAGPPKPEMDPAQMMAMMTKVIDKFFPAGPEPDPARLQAARATTFRSFPKGAYAEAMSGFVDRMADQVLSMSEADLADLVPPTPPKKGEKAKAPPSRVSLREQLSAKDPAFDAKVAAGKAFGKAMFGKLGDVLEPKFREGMARSMARKFDAAQIAEIDRFLATPTGAAYGRQMLGMWFEPEVMRGTFAALPEMMTLMPAVLKDVEALERDMKAAEPKKK